MSVPSGATNTLQWLVEVYPYDPVGAALALGVASWASGRAADTRSSLTQALDVMPDATLVAGYVKETGQEEQQIVDWMAAETWFTSQEAIDNGFADNGT